MRYSVFNVVDGGSAVLLVSIVEREDLKVVAEDLRRLGTPEIAGTFRHVILGDGEGLEAEDAQEAAGIEVANLVMVLNQVAELLEDVAELLDNKVDVVTGVTMQTGV